MPSTSHCRIHSRKAEGGGELIREERGHAVLRRDAQTLADAIVPGDVAIGVLDTLSQLHDETDTAIAALVHPLVETAHGLHVVDDDTG